MSSMCARPPAFASPKRRNTKKSVTAPTPMMNVPAAPVINSAF
jgi:hypothetical protein